MTFPWFRGPIPLSLSAIVMASCTTSALPPVPSPVAARASAFTDASRSRTVPTILYGAGPGRKRPLAILLPGYGLRNSDYSFIASALARHGYVVAAIQQQLDTDPPVPGGDDIIKKRSPSWQRGVEDARFVAGELRRRAIASDRPLLLVGHSHGGDTVMHFADQHPAEVEAVFALDNRRRPLPRTSRPRVCSARSSDQKPDAGVLPPEGQRTDLNMVIERVNVRHDDMSDSADEAPQLAILSVLERCMSGWSSRMRR